MAPRDMREISDAELPKGPNAGGAHAEKHACKRRICMDRVPRDEKHGMRERSGLLDRQPRLQELGRASRFAFEGHFAPASKVDKVCIREEHAASGGFSTLFESESCHWVLQRTVERKLAQDAITDNSVTVKPGPNAHKATRLSGHFFMNERPSVARAITTPRSKRPSSLKGRKV